MIGIEPGGRCPIARDACGAVDERSRARNLNLELHRLGSACGDGEVGLERGRADRAGGQSRQVHVGKAGPAIGQRAGVEQCEQHVTERDTVEQTFGVERCEQIAEECLTDSSGEICEGELAEFPVSERSECQIVVDRDLGAERSLERIDGEEPEDRLDVGERQLRSVLEEIPERHVTETVEIAERAGGAGRLRPQIHCPAELIGQIGNRLACRRVDDCANQVVERHFAEPRSECTEENLLHDREICGEIAEGQLLVARELGE